MNLDEHVEGRRRFAFEHRLLRPTPPRLFVGEGHGLDTAQQVVQRRVDEEVLQRVAVRGGDQLDTTLGDGARRDRFQLDADLVDHDHLRHVVLDGLDHHRMLQRRGAHLHSPRAPDPGMRDIAVSTNLI